MLPGSVRGDSSRKREKRERQREGDREKRKTIKPVGERRSVWQDLSLLRFLVFKLKIFLLNFDLI